MMCLWARKKKKNMKKNIFFFIPKINEEKDRNRSWIRIRTRTRMSKIPNTALVFISGTDYLTPDHSSNDRLTNLRSLFPCFSPGLTFPWPWFFSQQPKYPTLRRQNIEISKQIFLEKEYRGLSHNFHIHEPVSDLYTTTIGLAIPMEEICRPILGLYKSLTNTWMWQLHGAEAALFPEKEYISGIFVAVYLGSLYYM
jgi:hypothetical protein